jgi:uncharacterized membrane protein
MCGIPSRAARYVVRLSGTAQCRNPKGTDMDRTVFAASVLTAAIGLVAAAAALPARAQETQLAPGASPAVVQQNMLRAQQEHLARCYGVNAAGRNDCATAAHSCAGHATQAADSKSFVLLPAGDCDKIAGGVAWSNG